MDFKKCGNPYHSWDYDTFFRCVFLSAWKIAILARKAESSYNAIMFWERVCSWV